MSETRNYLVTKIAEPEALGAAYADSLERLPGTETDLAPDLPVIVKLREMTEDEAEKVRARGHIASVEESKIASVPEPEVVAQAAEQLDPEEVRNLCGFAAAYKAGGTGKGRKIAIIDTGYSEATKRELGARIVGAKSRIQGEDALNPEDSHGDWVLQIVAYLLPDAEFLVLKGLSYPGGSGSYDAIIGCVSDARAMGATEANMSLGGPASSAMDAAVDSADAAGLLVGVAAGNEQRGKAETDYLADRTSPARAKGVLTVAAAESHLHVAAFSNRGTSVDVSAPGMTIKAPNVERYWSGTSMACPVLVAACGAVASTGKTKAEVKQLVLSRARDTAASPAAEGQGFVDLAAVFAPAPERPAPAPKPAPGVPTMSRWKESRTKSKDLPERFVMTDKEYAFDCTRTRPPAGK